MSGSESSPFDKGCRLCMSDSPDPGCRLLCVCPMASGCGLLPHTHTHISWSLQCAYSLQPAQYLRLSPHSLQASCLPAATG